MALYAELKANGTKIDGTVTVPADLMGMIKIHSLAFDYTQGVDAGGHATGHRTASALHLVTNMGPHVVLLWQALIQNEEVAGKIFMDVSDDGDTPEFTVEIVKARVSSLEVGMSGDGPLISNAIAFDLQFPEITIRHEATGTETFDKLHQNV